jgi:hypothetical protein
MHFCGESPPLILKPCISAVNLRLKKLGQMVVVVVLPLQQRQHYNTNSSVGVVAASQAGRRLLGKPVIKGQARGGNLAVSLHLTNCTYHSILHIVHITPSYKL